jgi:hypothetical protein
MTQPKRMVFQDDGSIPNSRYAVLIYRGALDLDDRDPASSMEERFAVNHWIDSWRNGIYPFTTTTARVTKSSASSEGRPRCGSAVKLGRIFSWRRETCSFFPPAWAIKILERVNISAWWALTQMAANGICLGGAPASARRQTRISRRFQCRPQIRSMAQTVHSRKSGEKCSTSVDQGCRRGGVLEFWSIGVLVS